MLGSLFGKKKTKPSYVVARLNDRAQPIHRGEIYEDPLNEALQEHGFGEVTGGGTMLGVDKEIEYCDVEIQVVKTSDEGLALISGTLERLGAPKGSKLIVESDGREIPFGVNEGLAVYLNGTDLPDSVYAECDSNVVFAEFGRLLADAGSIHSWWQGPRETAFYLYGPSFDAMKALILPFVDSYPLCQRARLEKIA